MNVDEAIAVAKGKCTNEIALVYLNAMPAAVEWGVDGFETQLIYALGNMGTWRGPEAREVKQTMRNWIKENAKKKKMATRIQM